MKYLRAILLSLATTSVLPANASQSFDISNSASVTAPNVLGWDLYEVKENSVQFSNQLPEPPFYASFLTARVITIDPAKDRVEHILENAGKRLSRFSYNEAKNELLISYNYKRIIHLGTDCISIEWITKHPRKERNNIPPTFMNQRMIECPVPNTASQIVSLSFSSFGKETSIPAFRREVAEKFFNSLNFK
ncbi:hypothetical protein [Pseudomonas sp. EA_35y_Pfl2_R5]|uniref:hypothetical protein n=1 Tax=Pseudomonas sp. EA_35y_Pfl2_R5 TaxID=3088690 RepID=UPI0030DC0120